MVGFIKRKVKTLTLGEKLKKIRKKAGVSLVEIASHTKIKQDYLERIEAGDYENLPFDVYVKGFLRSYAKYLDLDSEKVVKQFEKEVGVRENVKKYQSKTNQNWSVRLPNLTITPKMASLFFSALVVVIGISYFYLEVDNFSKEPNLIIEAPISDGTVYSSSVEIIGKTDFENKITINNEPVYVDSEGKFKEKVGLQKGGNEIVIEAFNKFDRNTRKVINIAADYEIEAFVAGAIGENSENLENQETQESEDSSFEIEIESREVSSWISYKIDENKKQSNTLHPGTILKLKVENQIELSSGKARNTYVRINDGEFIVVDEKIKGFKRINLDKKGIVSENRENSDDPEKSE